MEYWRCQNYGILAEKIWKHGVELAQERSHVLQALKLAEGVPKPLEAHSIQ